jgi:hypothetical protein
MRVRYIIYTHSGVILFTNNRYYFKNQSAITLQREVYLFIFYFKEINREQTSPERPLYRFLLHKQSLQDFFK